MNFNSVQDQYLYGPCISFVVERPAFFFGHTQIATLMHFLKEHGFIAESNYNNADILDCSDNQKCGFYFQFLKNRVTSVRILPNMYTEPPKGLEAMKETADKVYDLVFLIVSTHDNPNCISMILSEASRVIKDSGKVVVYGYKGSMDHITESEKVKIASPNLNLHCPGSAYIFSK